MASPEEERLNPHNQHDGSLRDFDEDRTFVGDGSVGDPSHLRIDTNNQESEPYFGVDKSPSQAREQNHRLNDDLEMLRAEQVVSNNAARSESDSLSHSKSVNRTRSRHSEPVDEFDVATNPLHTKTAVYKPPENPTTTASKLFKKIHNSSFLVRYFTYITPLVVLILIPLLLGALLFKDASVGGVKLLWFCVWLEIIWLTLWAGRIVAKCIPYPMGLSVSLFTNNSKKWRDMGKQLEVPATVFFWWLGIEVSFLPTMKNHHVSGNTATLPWETILNKIIISIFAGTAMNFFVKIIIQLIAISFHLRTYADRIEINKFQIGSMTKLYTYSKEKIEMEDSDFDQEETGPSSGTRTPMQYLDKAHKNAREALSKVGDVAGKVAGDFTGRQVAKSTHPHQVVLQLLTTPHGSQVLARRLYRTFAQDGEETVSSEDLKHAFDNNEEAEAAFQMFDKDMNGDISMEELEAVCVDIGRERKSITASLKDLDSVVSKLDDVFFFFVCIITLLIFLTLISTSTAAVLTSAGSTVLALSWLFSTTAQEFLQSVIFVFVKHPFDVGDRVSIYGNTGALGRGDDYFVKEIALLYTEFKKMEGHVVQAPNSYLNTLFILNMRRSGGLAEAVPITFKFGTTLDQIDTFRQRLLEFVTAEKREYQPNILTELRDVVEAHAINLNVVFFYKSNWQNELLRLQRRNKFICAMMVTMQDLNIEGPRMRYPGQKEGFPVYLQNIVPQPNAQPTPGDTEGPGPRTGNLSRDTPSQSNLKQHPSILRKTHASGRPHAESLSAMGKRVDFSLGMRGISSGDMMSDLYDDRSPSRVPRFDRSPSQGRASNDGGSVARTTSHDTGLHPRDSEESKARLRSSHSTHRNRFFGRQRRPGEVEDSDLENGIMAGIPESGATPAARIDPRTGLVSPRAVNLDGTEAPPPRVPTAAAFGTGARPPPSDVGLPQRSATEDFEMRRLQ
ncbi:MAG: Cell cycle checkpoint protein rad17 [Chaenotheca gracillima]|nr:MAG: Cell cycle checkpoint protein rad17 [Chaenotheca gracillima]